MTGADEMAIEMRQIKVPHLIRWLYNISAHHYVKTQHLSEINSHQGLKEVFELEKYF